MPYWLRVNGGWISHLSSCEVCYKRCTLMSRNIRGQRQLPPERLPNRHHENTQDSGPVVHILSVTHAILREWCHSSGVACRLVMARATGDPNPSPLAFVSGLCDAWLLLVIAMNYKEHHPCHMYAYQCFLYRSNCSIWPLKSRPSNSIDSSSTCQ